MMPSTGRRDCSLAMSRHGTPCGPDALPNDPKYLFVSESWHPTIRISQKTIQVRASQQRRISAPTTLDSDGPQ